MSSAAHASRTHVWLESLGDWAWPGRAAEAVPAPPPWVPSHPPRLEPALAGAGGAAGAALPRRAPASARRALIALLLSALAAVSAALALKGSLPLQGLLGGRSAGRSVRTDVPGPIPPGAYGALDDAAPPPPLLTVSRDAAGSSIAKASFPSGSLRSEGSFLVYLPPGYETSIERYPVIYLLHGRQGHASAFLEIGIQHTLDRLITTHRVPPMIAVMVQDKIAMRNWRDIGSRHSATYVVEVQELVDRMLRTIPARSARAIAGSSMGGFGAMNVALANPSRFATVESWLGFFNNLGVQLATDRGVIRQLGLRAFLYGASEDPVANPEEDVAFAAELRAAGARATGVVYPGGHSLEKVSEHLATGLVFAGRGFSSAG